MAKSKIEKMRQKKMTAKPTQGRTERQNKFLQQKGYKVGQIIAEGKYYVVKQAKSLEDDREVVIKFVDKLDSTPFTYLQRLMQHEWKALKACRHKNIVEFIDILHTETTVYLIMGFAENGPLFKSISESESGKVSESQARIWFGQLIDAIDHCHKSGWAHRNITVNDILLDSHENVKLAGFSYASPIVRTENYKIRPSESFAVVRAYASPEILQRIPYDAIKFDIWCAGMVLYVMVMGSYPYTSEGKSNEELLAQMDCPLEFPEGECSSPPLKSLLQTMLSKAKTRPSIRDIKRNKFMEPYYKSKRSTNARSESE